MPASSQPRTMDHLLVGAGGRCPRLPRFLSFCPAVRDSVCDTERESHFISLATDEQKNGLVDAGLWTSGRVGQPLLRAP